MWIIQIFTFIGDESFVWYFRWNCTVNAVDKMIWSFCTSKSEQSLLSNSWLFCEWWENQTRKVLAVLIGFQNIVYYCASFQRLGVFFSLFVFYTFGEVDFQLWFEHNSGKFNVSTTLENWTNKFEKIQKAFSINYWILLWSWKKCIWCKNSTHQSISSIKNSDLCW